MTRSDAIGEAVRDAIAPVVAPLGLGVYDVELQGAGPARTLRVTVMRDARDAPTAGIDLEVITAATQAISPVLDVEPAIPGPYLLEVSSPGIERTLRRPEHFAGAVGADVSVKFHTDTGPKRVRGTLVECDTERCVVEVDGAREEIAYDTVTQARTVFEWGPQPRPGRARSSARSGKGSARAKEQS